MKAFLEFVKFVEIFKLAWRLYKKAGYEASRQKLLQVIRGKNDKKTAALVSHVLHDDEL